MRMSIEFLLTSTFSSLVSRVMPYSFSSASMVKLRHLLCWCLYKDTDLLFFVHAVRNCNFIVYKTDKSCNFDFRTWSRQHMKIIDWKNVFFLFLFDDDDDKVQPVMMFAVLATSKMARLLCSSNPSRRRRTFRNFSSWWLWLWQSKIHWWTWRRQKMATTKIANKLSRACHCANLDWC